MIWKLFKPKKILHIEIPYQNKEGITLETQEYFTKRFGKEYNVIVSMSEKNTQIKISIL